MQFSSTFFSWMTIFTFASVLLFLTASTESHRSSNSYLPKCFENYIVGIIIDIGDNKNYYMIIKKERAEVHKRKVFVLCRSCFFVLQIKLFFLRLIKSFFMLVYRCFRHFVFWHFLWCSRFVTPPRPSEISEKNWST